MSWNYRVIKRSDGYEIVEAYYNDESNIPINFTLSGAKPYGETLEELREDLEYMLEALSKPVLRRGYEIDSGDEAS